MPLPERLIRAMPHRRPITARIPPDFCASERAAVHGKILALKGQIRDLLRELNELTPVGRLSSELVVEIFTYLQQEQQWSSPKKTPFILTLTHVSRSWRAIALNCPALWNEIFFSDKTLVGEWLRRSRSSNLYVKMQVPLDSVLQQTFEHFHRIRGLWLEMPKSPTLASSIAPFSTLS
ncbi:hypothetical protein BDN72DRAFT_960138 [Pluteus cervinus]|uniref:Uncharacterized protein n=1 Tax=Pluteus cervinus TaxID=181527 RepID=A0ACD3ARS5_9AGAR|nr:hypothetical protein BDN72DRAFT_960138 [Pluteus cervinus]